MNANADLAVFLRIARDALTRESGIPSALAAMAAAAHLLMHLAVDAYLDAIRVQL